MGYNTSHELEVVQGDLNLIEELRNESEGARYAIGYNGNARQDCKWYSHEEDLRAFSKKHPEAILRLNGEGEESGDIWTEYYKNGKMQKCKAKITFDDYCEDKLK